MCFGKKCYFTRVGGHRILAELSTVKCHSVIKRLKL